MFFFLKRLEMHPLHASHQYRTIAHVAFPREADPAPGDLECRHYRGLTPLVADADVGWLDEAAHILVWAWRMARGS